jgi:hypothetical protein
MRLKKINSQAEILIKINKYRINWDKDGSSKPEKKFIELIKPFWKNCIILFQLRLPGSLLRLDFLNCSLRIGVEISPKSHHDNFNPFFHKNRIGFLKSIKSEIVKEKWCEDNNIRLLTLDDNDLDNFSPKYIEKKFGIYII